jgi:hypothetical protein
VNGMEVDESNIEQLTNTDKKEEVEMLKEFEKRRKFQSVQDLVDRIEEGEGVPSQQRRKPKEEKVTNKKDTIELVFEPDADKGEIFDPL